MGLGQAGSQSSEHGSSEKDQDSALNWDAFMSQAVRVCWLVPR